MKRNFGDPQYKEWRKKVYARDRHQCRWPHCGSRKKLNAHHIKTWAHFPGLRFEVANGITLCKYHHDMIKGMEEIYAAVLLRLASSNNEQ
jgi:hypothetical protein